MKKIKECIKTDQHEIVVEIAKKEMYGEESISNICNILKVLSEPSRLKIVLALSKGEMCVYHIVEAVNSNQSAVSHQLRILKDNNIVKSKRDGQSIVYSLVDEHIMQIISLVKIHVEE